LKSKLLIASLAASSLFFSSCSLEEILNESSKASVDDGKTIDQKVAEGLKLALKIGIDSSAVSASKVNGYLLNKAISIALPEDAQKALLQAEEIGKYLKPFKQELSVINSLVEINPFMDKKDKVAGTNGMTNTNSMLSDILDLENLSQNIIGAMNEAAEKAAPSSVDIFGNAITGMSFTQALNLLNSNDSTAATQYLNGQTFRPLTSAYAPIMDATIAQVPLTEYWTDFRTSYNSILENYNTLLEFQSSWNKSVGNVETLSLSALPTLSYNKIETESLGEWTTVKALDGLFFLVGGQEKKIRQDPLAFAGDLLDAAKDIFIEVFDDIMDMQDS
jgi:hypothetical protein